MPIHPLATACSRISTASFLSPRIARVTPEEAAAIVVVNPRAIYRRLEAGDLHFVEDGDGALWICPLLALTCEARRSRLGRLLLLDWQQLDAAEFDPVFPLALESDDTGGVLRIVGVEQGLAVQDDREVVALGSDLVVVPLAGEDLDGRGLDGSHQAAGIVAGRLIIPDLQLVTGDVRLPFFLRPQEYAAVDLLRPAKLQLQDIVRKRLGSPQPAGRRARADKRPVLDFPVSPHVGLPAVEALAVEQKHPAIRGLLSRQDVARPLRAGQARCQRHQSHCGNQASHIGFPKMCTSEPTAFAAWSSRP